MNRFDWRHLPREKGAYLVGGPVRDLLLERPATDYDIAVSGNPDKYARHLARIFDGRVVRLGKPGKSVLRVVASGPAIDVSELASGGIEPDLAHRDFTVNAMALDLATGAIIDPFGGRRDLEQKTIRMTSPQVFTADPLRLLRAFRLEATLGLTVEPGTLAAIAAQADTIARVAGERIRDEWFKIVAVSLAGASLRNMSRAGLLTAIFPELGPLQGLAQGRHHRFDAYEHTLRGIEHLETILAGGSALGSGVGRALRSAERQGCLKTAMVLHDIGKPAARRSAPDGTVGFPGHAARSAEMAARVAARLRFSNHERREIDFLVRHHLRPLHLYLAHAGKSLTARGRARFLRRCGDAVPGLLVHAAADAMAKQSDPEAPAPFVVFLSGLLDQFVGIRDAAKGRPPLLTGHDLKAELQLTPSPLFRTLLDRVVEARMAGIVQDRSQALELVRELLAEQGDTIPVTPQKNGS